MSQNPESVIQKLIDVKGKQNPIFQTGTTSSIGHNKVIQVVVGNKRVNAMAWNIKQPGQVTVFWDEKNKRYVAWEGVKSSSGGKRTTTLALRKTRPSGGVENYYFIVGQDGGLLEGFGKDKNLSANDVDLTDYEIISVTNLGDGHIAVLKENNTHKIVTTQQVSTVTFLPTLFLNDNLPSIEYRGQSFWYWRIVNPIATNFVDIGSELDFSSTWSIHPCFITPCYTARYGRSANGITFPINSFKYHYAPSLSQPTQYNSNIIPSLKLCRYFFNDSIVGDYYQLSFPSTNGTKGLNFDYKLGDTLYPNTRRVTYNYSETGLSSSQSYNFTTQTQYPVAIETGFDENPSVTVYTISQSGTGSRSTTSTSTTYPDHDGTVTTGSNTTTSFNIVSSQPSNDSMYREVSYVADQTSSYSLKGVLLRPNRGLTPLSWGDTIETVSQTETWVEYTKLDKEVLYKSENILFICENILDTRFTTEYNGEYQILANAPSGEYDEEEGVPGGVDPGSYTYIEDVSCTLTEDIYLYNRPISSLSVNGIVYSFATYINETYTPWRSYYLITSNNFVVIKFSANFEDESAKFKKIVTNAVSTKGYTQNSSTPSFQVIDTVDYTHSDQDIVVLSGNVDLFTKTSDSSTTKDSGNIVLQHTLTTDVFQQEYYNIQSVTYTSSEQLSIEYFAMSDSCDVGDYVIVPQNDYGEVVYHLLKTYITRCNVYIVTDENGNDTVELAIAQIPTTTTKQRKHYADIYRFNTSTLKWERRPNAVSPLSKLTNTSDFISYHPKPINKKRTS